jgi:hypothetical protein
MLLMGVIVAARQWGPPAWKRANLLRLQHSCLTYSAPEHEVVYEGDLQAAAALLHHGDAYAGIALTREDLLLGRQVACRVPRCWSQLRFELIAASPVWPFNANVAPVIYLGKRVSPAGHERLVCVRYFPSSDPTSPVFVNGWDCECIVVTPAATWSPPVLHALPRKVILLNVLSNLPPAPTSAPRQNALDRIYAGQADPEDRSHFYLLFERGGQIHSADGYLQDSDDVIFKIR